MSHDYTHTHTDARTERIRQRGLTESNTPPSQRHATQTPCAPRQHCRCQPESGECVYTLWCVCVLYTKE
jgi:hypothetical protein